MPAHFVPDLDQTAVDAMLARAAVGSAPGRGAKLAPALNAQLATVAAGAADLKFDAEAPGFVLALVRAKAAG